MHRVNFTLNARGGLPEGDVRKCFFQSFRLTKGDREKTRTKLDLTLQDRGNESRLRQDHEFITKFISPNDISPNDFTNGE